MVQRHFKLASRPLLREGECRPNVATPAAEAES